MKTVAAIATTQAAQTIVITPAMVWGARFATGMVRVLLGLTGTARYGVRRTDAGPYRTRLSGDGIATCATCHNPDRAFTDGRPVSVGIHGRVGQRDAPTIQNDLYNKH
jgi:hypothetical protein